MDTLDRIGFLCQKGIYAKTVAKKTTVAVKCYNSNNSLYHQVISVQSEDLKTFTKKTRELGWHINEVNEEDIKSIVNLQKIFSS